MRAIHMQGLGLRCEGENARAMSKRHAGEMEMKKQLPQQGHVRMRLKPEAHVACRAGNKKPSMN